MTPPPTPAPPEISVAIPCLNEAENIVPITEAIIAELDRAGATYEFVFIDNSSTDGTVELIKGMCAQNPCLRLIVNNRNYGQMRSPTYGIYQTRGRAVLAISSDFQDPPELIGELIARWRAGTMIVLGVRQTENTTLFLRFVRAVGYGFFNRFGDYPIIPGATGFGVYDRRVVDCLSQWRDPEPFFRGMLVESGFSLETIPYHRPERAGGRSKNNFLSIISFGVAGLASCSKLLLRVPIYIAGAVFLLSGFSVIGSFVAAFFNRPAFIWMFFALGEFCFALVFLFLGLMGEQIRMIAEMTRNVPLVIERERVNFPGPEA